MEAYGPIKAYSLVRHRMVLQARQLEKTKGISTDLSVKTDVTSY